MNLDRTRIAVIFQEKSVKMNISLKILRIRNLLIMHLVFEYKIKKNKNNEILLELL